MASLCSEDTDSSVAVALLRKKIHSLGLQNLFLQLGKGKKRRMFPVQIIFEKFKKDLCREILCAHNATGCFI